MIDLKIVTPKGILHKSEQVVSVTIPTTEGFITVLEDHTPLLTVLDAGEIIVTDSKGKRETIEVQSGIVEVRKDSFVNILATEAENVELSSIEQKAAIAERKALDYMGAVQAIEDNEVAYVQGEIEKELAQKRGNNKYKNVGGIVAE